MIEDYLSFSFLSLYTVIPYVVSSFTVNSFTPDVYAGPTIANLQTALNGICNVQDSVAFLYRQDSLNYIQAMGLLTIDQANQYIPSIVNAYQSYFAIFPSPVILLSFPAIQNLQVRIINQLIVTRIYYQIFANTPQPCDAFNYQVGYTRFAIQPPPNLSGLVARLVSLGRLDLIDQAKITDVNLILFKLPHLGLETIIASDQVHKLENTLVNFWLKIFKDNNQIFNNIQVQIATGQYNINTQTKEFLTNVYYIMAVDGKIKYSGDLPSLNAQSVI